VLSLPDEADSPASRFERLHRRCREILLRHDEIATRVERHDIPRVRPEVEDLPDPARCRRFVGSRLGIRLGERLPRIVVAALNPAMLRLAGEVADGVLLNYLPADHVPWSIDQVRTGEETGGRPRGATTIHAYVHVGVGDREAGRTPARRDLFSYVVVDAYARSFERAGFGPEVAAVRERFSVGDRDGALAAVSERMIDAIEVVGDADEVRATIRAYGDAGVDDPIVMPLPWADDRWAAIDATMEAAAAALP